MLAFVDFLRDNLYWILFLGFCFYSGYKYFRNYSYNKKLQQTVCSLVDCYEKVYFGDSVVSCVNEKDFPLANEEFYIKTEDGFSKHGFKIVGDFQESTANEKESNYDSFIRAMTREKGTMLALFYDFVNTNSSNNVISSHKNIEICTYFSNDTILSTVPLKYKNESFCLKQIQREFPEIDDVGELIEYHKNRLGEFLLENPEADIIQVISFEDLVNVLNREHDLYKNIVEQKGCLISNSEFIISSGKYKIHEQVKQRLWQACVEEQKKRGYWLMEDDKIKNKVAEEPELVADVDEECGSEGEDNTAAVPEDANLEPVPKDRLDSIAEQVELSQKKKPNPWNGLITLVVSLLIFFSLGWFKWSLDFVGYIIVVLFIHEMGHYLAMRMFGYRNLKMFFIPLLGAAVSGHGHNISTYKKVLVSLAGPLPGIVLGLVMVWFSLATNNEMFGKLASILLFLNGFNLLPFLPLDGGWVMHHTLYSRFPILEVGTRVIAACLFALAAFGSGDFIFYLLAFINFAGISRAYKDAKFVKNIKGEIAAEGNCDLRTQGSGLIEIPRQWLGGIADYLSDTRKLRAHDTIAKEALDLWDRAATRPTGVFATLGLWLLTFLVGWCGLLAGGIASAGLLEPVFENNEIVEYEKEGGITGLKLVGYCYNNKSHICREIELTDDGELYHGSHKKYWRGELIWEGQWENGLKVGEWKRYWFGEHDTLRIYEDGRLASEKVRNDYEGWEDIEPDSTFPVSIDEPENEEAEVYADLRDEVDVFPDGPDPEVLGKWRSNHAAD